MDTRVPKKDHCDAGALMAPRVRQTADAVALLLAARRPHAEHVQCCARCALFSHAGFLTCGLS